MTDRSLHRLLTDVDTASPPPPAVPFTQERLQALLQRRRRRAALLAVGAVAAAACTVLLLRAPAMAATSSPPNLAALRAELDAGFAVLEHRMLAFERDRAQIDDSLRRGRLACDRAIAAGQQFARDYATFDPAAAARQSAAFAAMHEEHK
jgi:hypothetical protein